MDREQYIKFRVSFVFPLCNVGHDLYFFISYKLLESSQLNNRFYKTIIGILTDKLNYWATQKIKWQTIMQNRQHNSSCWHISNMINNMFDGNRSHTKYISFEFDGNMSSFQLLQLIIQLNVKQFNIFAQHHLNINKKKFNN